MSKTTVLTPKLRCDVDWWEDGDGREWLCHDELSDLFALEDAEVIQAEVSDAPLRDGLVIWLQYREEVIFGGSGQTMYWGVTAALVRRTWAGILCVAASDFLLNHFTITDKPTKLYVRVWLLTGKDAKDD